MANEKIIITADSKKNEVELLVNTTKFVKSLGKAEKQLKNFTDSPFEATLSMEDNATTAIRRVMGLASNFANTTYKATLSIDAAKATSGINLIKRQLNGLTVKGWNLKLNIMPSVTPGNAGYSHQTQYNPTEIYAAPDNAGPLERTVYGFAALGSLIGSYKTLSEAIGSIKESVTHNGLKSTAIGGLSRVGNVMKYLGVIEGAGTMVKGLAEDNSYDRKNNLAKGGTILATTLGGAKLGGMLGGMFGGPLGAAIGGTAGYVLGKAGGDSIASLFTGGMIGAQKDAGVSEDAAKRLEVLRAKQAELAKSKLDEKFGKITLSAAQLSAVTENLFNHTQTARIYNANVAISDMNDSMCSLQLSTDRFKKELWAASAVRGQLNPEQRENLMSSTASFNADSSTALQDQQYGVSSAISALAGDSGMEKDILALWDKASEKKRKKFNNLEQKLNDTAEAAGQDGYVSNTERRKMDKLQEKISSLINGGENQGNLGGELNEILNGSLGDTTWDSFNQVIDSSAQGANARKDVLENAYTTASPYLSKEENKMLRLGENGKGDKEGLYSQQTDLYTNIANKALDIFSGKFGDELGIFNQPVDDIINGGMSPEAIKQTGKLMKDDEGKAALGEVVDSLAPVTDMLLQQAKRYEAEGLEVPKETQDILKIADLYKHISDDKTADWFYQSAGPNKDKFNLKDYAYLPQGPRPEVPVTPGVTGNNTVSDLQNGQLQPQQLPVNMQLMLNGKPIIAKGGMLTQEDFGIPRDMQAETIIYINETKVKGIRPKGTKPKEKTNFNGNVWANSDLVDKIQNNGRKGFRGGIIGGGAYKGFADGGYVGGGAQLITVAEEGTPEAIIPLGSHRRKRALELFSQVGRHLAVPGFAMGGIVGGTIGGSGSPGGSPVVQVGGVEIKIEAKDGQSLVETIREHKDQISEEIAGVFNAAFKGQFANTPAVGGAS